MHTDISRTQEEEPLAEEAGVVEPEARLHELLGDLDVPEALLLHHLT